MDIARPDKARRKRVRQVSYGAGAAMVILLIALGVSRLQPAAPTVDRSIL